MLEAVKGSEVINCSSSRRFNICKCHTAELKKKKRVGTIYSQVSLGVFKAKTSSFPQPNYVVCVPEPDRSRSTAL